MTDSLKWKIKRFNELSLDELYQLLLLRSKVFVVEQNCVYQDLDGKDENALHVIGVSGEVISGYARLFGKGEYFDDFSIGRVVVAKEFRGKDLGHELMRQCIEAIALNFGPGSITISAQLYLKEFYRQHGFIVQGESYLEDDIPHIRMKRL